MLQMANCPQCKHEFYPDDSHGDERVHCPRCGADVSLTDSANAGEETLLAPVDAADHERSDDSVDPASRRIEKWFHSAETVDEMPIGNIGYPLDAQFKNPTANNVENGPAKTERIRRDQGATIDLAEPLETSHSHVNDNEELTLEPPEPLPTPSATWDDSERIERLLADIEAKQNNDYLPVAREPRTSPDDELTLEDTSQYQPEPGAGASQPYDNTWNTDVTGDETTMAATMLGSAPRRKSSLLRVLVMAGVGGIMGLGIANYALMWWYGPNGDLLKIAPYVPKQMLPASFRHDASAVAADTSNKPLATDETTTAGTNTPRESAEVPASFEAPVTAPTSDNHAVPGDRYAKAPTGGNAADVMSGEPARFADQAATPLFAAKPPTRRVQGAPSYTVDQFNLALAAAHEAQAGLVYGDLNDLAVQRTKGTSYNRFCDLAEIATFLDDTHDTPAAIGALRSDAERLYRDTLAEPRIRGEVARIVPVWIGASTRRHGGIFFAGSIQRSTERGSVTECLVNTGEGDPLTVLVPPALADRLAGRQRTFVVVGSLIDRPVDRVPGYDGAARQAVWVISLIPLGE